MEHIQEKSASVMAVEAKQAFFAPAKAKTLHAAKASFIHFI